MKKVDRRAGTARQCRGSLDAPAPALRPRSAGASLGRALGHAPSPGCIAGCGFHLRGDVTYAFSTLYINSPANVPFTARAEARARGGGSATLVDNAAAAQAIFDISSVTDDKQVLSLSSGGRVREYLLTKRVTFALHDADGRDWLPAAEIVDPPLATRSASPKCSRARRRRQRLYKEMQTDAVQQIVQAIAGREEAGVARRTGRRLGARRERGTASIMELRLNQLAAHLERTLAPIYVVHGDEPLLAIEAGDAIRAAARRAGYDEREVLVVEPGFSWDAFLAASANLGLFGSRKLVDLRIPSGKPGVEGARALEACAAHPNADQMLLVTLPRLDRATQSSAWFSALARRGRRDRRLSAGARRAAGVDRGAPRAAGAARRAGDARLPRRPLRGQPARRAAGDREARPAAARGRARRATTSSAR